MKPLIYSALLLISTSCITPNTSHASGTPAPTMATPRTIAVCQMYGASDNEVATIVSACVGALEQRVLESGGDLKERKQLQLAMKEHELVRRTEASASSEAVAAIADAARSFGVDAVLLVEHNISVVSRSYALVKDRSYRHASGFVSARLVSTKDAGASVLWSGRIAIDGGVDHANQWAEELSKQLPFAPRATATGSK